MKFTSSVATNHMASLSEILLSSTKVGRVMMMESGGSNSIDMLNVVTISAGMPAETAM